MTKDEVENFLKSYIAYWSTQPVPEHFTEWGDDPGRNFGVMYQKLVDFLNNLSNEQLQGLAQYLDKGAPGDPNVNPPIPPTPPQPYIIKMIALALISAPIWIAQRLNFIYPTASAPASVINWLIFEFNRYKSLADNWARSKNMIPVCDILAVWDHGSDEDIKKMYPQSSNFHSIQTLSELFKLTLMSIDKSEIGHVPDPTPQYIDEIISIFMMGETN